MIVVFGAIAAHLTIPVPALPGPGDWPTTTGYDMAAGGRGLVQALAVAHQDQPAALAGAVGDDALGEAVLATIRGPVATEGVRRAPDAPTGVITGFRDDAGDGLGARAAGANRAVTGADGRTALAGAARADALLLDAGLPVAATQAAARHAQAHGVPSLLVLDPWAAPPPAALVTAASAVIADRLGLRAAAAGLGLASASPRASAQALAHSLARPVWALLDEAGAVAATPDTLWLVGEDVRAGPQPGRGLDTFAATVATLYADSTPVGPGLGRAAAAASLAEATTPPDSAAVARATAQLSAAEPL